MQQFSMHPVFPWKQNEGNENENNETETNSLLGFIRNKVENPKGIKEMVKKTESE